MTRVCCIGAFLFWFSATYLIGAETIGPKAVWKPGTGSIQTIIAKCTKPEPSDLNGCFIGEMRASGASPEALAFSQQLQNETHGFIGFLREFRDTGKVDIAYVEYVFRANENQGCYLVNGNPGLIDVDNLQLLATKNLESDAGYAAIEKRYPVVSIWPGDRNSLKFPVAEKLPQGGQRFIVDYWLQNGCHACARVGQLQFAFDFDSSGNFQGAHLHSVEAAETK